MMMKADCTGMQEQAAVASQLVIPAKAGIHFAPAKKTMDSRFRGNDECRDAPILEAVPLAAVKW